MRQKIILDLCGGTGSWSKPYKDAGYEVYLVTLPTYDVTKAIFNDDGVIFPSQIQGQPDFLIFNGSVWGILAAPPCTEFSVAKDHKLTRDLDKGMEIVNACLRVIKFLNPVFYAIENPVGKLTNFLGKPQFSFQPYEFGDAWTKRTQVWGKFNLPIKKFKKYSDVPPIKGLYVRPGRKTASIAFNHKSHKKFIKAFDGFAAATDADFRAITPAGFAKAFYRSNK